jgi:hypothetical protein
LDYFGVASEDPLGLIDIGRLDGISGCCAVFDQRPDLVRWRHC